MLRHIGVAFAVTRDARAILRNSLRISLLQSSPSPFASRHRKRREEKKRDAKRDARPGRKRMPGQFSSPQEMSAPIFASVGKGLGDLLSFTKNCHKEAYRRVGLMMISVSGVSARLSMRPSCLILGLIFPDRRW
jgi:hypothetical protein